MAALAFFRIFCFPLWVMIFSATFANWLYCNTIIQNNLIVEPTTEFFFKHLKINEFGKIDIGKDVEHIKLDIGLSWSAPMTQVWLATQDNLLVFGFEPNLWAINFILQGPRIPDDWANGYIGSQHPLRSKSPIPDLLGSRFFIIPCALGLSETTTTAFYITKDDCGCSSIYPPKQLPVEEVIEVPIFSLSKFFDIFPFETHPVIDYIKIDTQGSDLDIVKSGGKYLQERVVCITLEPENEHYVGTNNSIQDIERYMNGINFIRYVSKNTSDPTYVNIQFMQYFLDNCELQIFQEG